MSTLVIKNLPETLHEKLRRQAERNHRSMTKEAVTLLEAGMAASEAGAPGVAPSLDIVDYIGRWPRYKSIDEVNEYVRELRKDRDED